MRVGAADSEVSLHPVDVELIFQDHHLLGTEVFIQSCQRLGAKKVTRGKSSIAPG